MKTLLIGGARSGKSRHAEQLLADVVDVDYVATGYPPPPDDAEWAARVAAHVASRPASWRTRETTDLVGVLAEDGPPVLVDCLTLWLTRLMDERGAWDGPVDLSADLTALADAVAATSRDVVLVTNEVGQGVVPATASGRAFRDEMGRLNLLVAEAVEDVLWCVAGRVVRM